MVSNPFDSEERRRSHVRLHTWIGGCLSLARLPAGKIVDMSLTEHRDTELLQFLPHGAIDAGPISVALTHEKHFPLVPHERDKNLSFSESEAAKIKI